MLAGRATELDQGTQPGDQVLIATGLDPALDGGMRDLVACPVVHRAEGGVLAQLGIRHRAVDPVEQAEERARVEHLVVDRPEGLGASDDLTLVVGLGRRGGPL